MARRASAGGRRAGRGRRGRPGHLRRRGPARPRRGARPRAVVVGSSHRGTVGQVLAGNVALRLLNGLDRPLAVAPAGYADEATGLGRSASASTDRRSRAPPSKLRRGWPATRVPRWRSSESRSRMQTSPPIRGHSVGERARSETISTNACADASSRRPAACRTMSAIRRSSTPARRPPCCSTRRTRSTCWCSARAATGPCAGCCSARSPASSCAKPACPVSWCHAPSPTAAVPRASRAA